MRYTCGFMFDKLGRVALVEKNKPAWQAGKLNGIGGGMEAGETPYESQVREFFEETGVHHTEWEYVCSLEQDGVEVTFFAALVEQLPRLPIYNDIGEMLVIIPIDDVSRWPHVPNLTWLMPMCLKTLYNEEAVV